MYHHGIQGNSHMYDQHSGGGVVNHHQQQHLKNGNDYSHGDIHPGMFDRHDDHVPSGGGDGSVKRLRIQGGE
jgi:hypothetical protein